MKYTLTFQSSLFLSLCIRISISVHAGTEFLGMCWQWWISGPSQKCHPHSCCFIFINMKKSQGASLVEYGEYGTTNVFLSAEICCTDEAVCVSALLMVNQPFLILLSFRAFSMDLLGQTLQNLPVAMQFNRLAWRNKFLMNSAPAVKKWSPTCCDVWYDLPCFVQIWKQLLFVLWLQQETQLLWPVLAVERKLWSLLTSTVFWTWMPMLLLTGEQPKHRLHRGTLHIYVLSLSSVACCTWET